MFRTFRLPIPWPELIKRTYGQIRKDNVLGLAAQLSYYLLLALAPAILFLVALTSYLPGRLIDRLIALLSSVAPPTMTELLTQQLQAISQGQHGGLLTFGVLFAVWSSSAAIVGAMDAMNRVYDIEEGRPWWKVRLTAILLTIALAVLVVLAMALVIAGPWLAEWLAAQLGFGPAFEWAWKIAQWPLVLAMITIGLGLLNYYGPDAQQDWEWITPGALLATVLWLLASVAFRFYVVNFGNYNETYGTLGAVIVLMLWFYISSLVVLVGGEMNAEIEHASPHGKDPGEKVPGRKKTIGAAAAREWEKRQARQPAGGQDLAPAPPRAWGTPETSPRRMLPQPASFWSLLSGLPLVIMAWLLRRRTKT